MKLQDLDCRALWARLYSQARRQGLDHHDAEDLVQAFLAHALQRRLLDQLDEARGSLQSFLHVTFRNFVLNELERRGAQKRGGHLRQVSLNTQEVVGAWSSERDRPERRLERLQLRGRLVRVHAAVRQKYADRGRGETFDVLHPYAIGEARRGSREVAARRLGLSAPAFTSALHRLRREIARALAREDLASNRTRG